MIDFIDDTKKFEQIKSNFLRLFNSGVSFEENPFHQIFNNYLAFEFDFIYHERFFNDIKNFLPKIGEKNLIFYTIEPSSEEYFFKHFRKYSAFEVGVENTDRELSDIMMKDPGESPADAFAINSNYIAIFSYSNQWAIIGSRDWEIAIVGFRDVKTRNLFLASFREDADMFFSVKKQVELYFKMLGFSATKRRKYEELIKNYQDRV